MKIAVIGAGYVGLVTGVCLAEIGHSVTCIDVDSEKIRKMSEGISPIYEPGLEELMVRNINFNRLTFTTNYHTGLLGSEAIFIAVGTPQSKDGSADLTYIFQAAKEIARNISQDAIVITKSTVPVGTNRLIKEAILNHLKEDVKIEVASNPEFLREGHAIYDTFHGDRIVIGANNTDTASFIEKIYEPMKIPVLRTGIESAELIKYASNAFLVTKISFINEIANLCEKVGANVIEVAKGMGMDHRIGSEFLNAGIGYGGSCFPKDTNALIHLAHTNGYQLDILESVMNVNKRQPLKFVEKISHRFGTLKNRKIAILGLSFKPNTDDMREASSILVINELLKEGAKIVAFDPVAINNAKKVLSQKVAFAKTKYDALAGSEACLILTEWDEFKAIDWRKAKELMMSPIIFDGRFCLSKEELSQIGFEYYAVDSPIISKNQEAMYV